MLYNLHILNSKQDNSDTCNINYIEQMKILSELDINIFPKMGPIQNRKPQERVQKLKELQEEIKQLREEIEKFSEQDGNEEVINTYDKNFTENLDLLNHISTLANNSTFLLKEKKKEGRGVFNKDFDLIVANCHSHISDILKVCKYKEIL